MEPKRPVRELDLADEMEYVDGTVGEPGPMQPDERSAGDMARRRRAALRRWRGLDPEE
jgi:hypothetical protein